MSKKKKEKVIWYDDNSTISDMSDVGRGGAKKSKESRPTQPKKYSTAKEKWNTYWSAVKMMFLPMCVALIIILILYLLLMLIAV